MRRRDDAFPDNGFEAWGGYMNAKKSKLEEQFSARAGTEETLSNIFNGVNIYVNGFTVPSADELKILMTKHGGIYHTYQRSDDFIIASNLPDTKVKNMNLAKVVKPEWIVESLAANRLLDYRDYLLYKNSRTQKQLNFKKVVKFNDTKLFNAGHETKFEEIKGNCIKEEQSLLEVHQTIAEVKPSTSHSAEDSTSNVTTSDSLNIVKQNTGAITKTAADPDFIAEFYKNSRLHHISQLGACFKQHINELRDNSNFQFPARQQLREKIFASNNLNNFSQLKFEKNKIIMHIDMDCFFVSVGLRNRPDLIGKPVAVTHSKGGQGRARSGADRSTEFNLYKQRRAQKLGIATEAEDEVKFTTRVDDIGEEDSKYGSMSEIASCSYEARAKGLKNGMFMGPALKLCPDLQTIPYDFDGYKEVAYTLYNTVAQYTLDIEAVSCDEMYVDCTELLSDMNINVQSFATMLREEIKGKTGCPCSTGFGGNRLQARLATKKAKPDGQFFLTEDLIEDFIYDIKLKELPGVGGQTAYKLESLGHVTCGSLQTLTLATLKSHLGNKTGAQLFDQCRGRDPNPLTFHTVRKSVSAEVNYGIRFENNHQCLEFLKQLSAEVHSRMLQFKVLGKSITLKLMVRAANAPVETAKFMGHGYCDVINKSVALHSATNDLEVITKEVIALCKKQNLDPTEMRGIGIQVTKLEYVSSKPTVGAMNKFLFHNKAPNAFIKKGNISPVKVAPIPQGVLDKSNHIKTPTTPNESKTTSSPKKLPTLPVRSPTKRRGRPPKHSKPQSTSKTLKSMFVQGQTVARDIPYKDPMMREPVKEEIEVKVEPPQAPHGLLGLPWKRVRDLLRAWLDSGQTPLQCDVDMIIEYLQEMVINKNIEKLQVLMNFLRRMTREIGSIAWLEVYNRISEKVQNAMIAVYGKKLYISN